MNAAVERLVCSVAPVEAVLRLSKHFPVFPCRRYPENVMVRGALKLMKAKSPLTQHGLHDASQDESTIRAWWAQWPDALAGVPTGSTTQLVVVDFDAPKADAAANEWLMAHTEQLLTTRSHTTLNGGRHYVFRAPSGVEYRNGVCLTLEGVKRNGIDLRAEGGYIVWWPLHGGMTTGEISPLPAGLVDEQRNDRRPEKRPENSNGERELPPLSAHAPEKWARDRQIVADALAYLDPSDYDVWSRAGLAIHLASGGSDDGFGMWNAWSAGEITGEVPHNYGGTNDCRYHWGSYRHDKDRAKLVTLGSLFELAKAKGFVAPKMARESPPVDVYEKDLEGRVGHMLVTGAEPEFDEDPDEVLIDVMKLDGRELLTEYERRRSKFGTTPFDPDGERFRLYPGGVTIWSGFPGAGKTTLLRQLVCHCLARGSSVFLATFEEDPRDVLVNLACVAAGREMPNAHQMQWFLDAYGERFRLWGVIGIAQHRKLLAVIRKLAAQGVRHAIIDSLMCLDVANDDFEAQRKFANLLSATARAANIHIHLVAHPRKLVSASQEPDINDVAGAREIGGIADNVVFIRRSETETDNPLAASTPMCIAVRKQRHWRGSIGNITGWFHRDYRQFHTEQFVERAIRYLPEDAYT
jgi:KaiC/GvpD/RAD55 family RecA-like ATPase